MKTIKICLALSLLTFSACQKKGGQMGYEGWSIGNPEQEKRCSPEDWIFESQRNEVRPAFAVNHDLIFRNNPTLTVSGGGKEHANGCWYWETDITPEKYYKFRVHYMANNVEQPLRSVLARILWMDNNRRQVGAAEYPKTLRDHTPENWGIMEQVYKAPLLASWAKIELVYRWDADGQVHFGDFSFVEVDQPPARKVRLATVFHRPRNTKNAQENLNQFEKLIAEAGAQKADFICLPEGVTLVGTGKKYVDAAEHVPGPTTRFLSRAARENNMYIIAGILEREGDVVYNTAVLIDRKGELAGKYRKVSLPREEIEGGVTPGNSIPVFDTDFGRIGIMICWDVTFPEVARTLALRGAEVIFLPIWGGNLTLAQARSIENQVYLVSSTYDMKSAIFDLEGNIISEATDANPVVVSEIDLNEQKLWPWLGDFKNRIVRELPSRESYY